MRFYSGLARVGGWLLLVAILLSGFVVMTHLAFNPVLVPVANAEPALVSSKSPPSADLTQNQSPLDVFNPPVSSVNTQLTQKLYSPPSLETTAVSTAANEPKKAVDVTSFNSFGSQAILDACWTKDQLRGNDTDRLIHKQPADRSPPFHVIPAHQPIPLAARLQGSIRTIVPDPDKKLVALTFDLCEAANEKAGYEANIVNYLRDHNIAATFYAGGKWMRSHPDKTKQLMADPLFEIGNHSCTHGNLRQLTGEKMQTQVLWTQAEYEDIWQSLKDDLPRCGLSVAEMDHIPPIPLSFRYPYGACSAESLNFMETYGLPSIQWNIVTADPGKQQTAQAIANTILQGIKPGSIIVAHANGRGWHTAEALPQFIPQLQEQGYRFVTVSQLIAEGKSVEAASTCYELSPGDNFRYDHLAKKSKP